MLPSIEDFRAARKYMDDFRAGLINPENLIALLAKARARNELRDRKGKKPQAQRLAMTGAATVRPATPEEIRQVSRQRG